MIASASAEPSRSIQTEALLFRIVSSPKVANAGRCYVTRGAGDRVVPVVDGVGVYGGRLNLVSFGTFGDMGHATLQSSFGEHNDGSIFPDFMESMEVSDDPKTYTFHLRKGLKWSDGVPATTDDVRFWFEDGIGNEEISPAKPS